MESIRLPGGCKFHQCCNTKTSNTTTTRLRVVDLRVDCAACTIQNDARKAMAWLTDQC